MSVSKTRKKSLFVRKKYNSQPSTKAYKVKVVDKHLVSRKTFFWSKMKNFEKSNKIVKREKNLGKLQIHFKEREKKLFNYFLLKLRERILVECFWGTAGNWELRMLFWKNVGIELIWEKLIPTAKLFLIHLAWRLFFWWWLIKQRF